MPPVARLLICRYTDKHDPHEPDHLGFLPSHRRTLRGTMPIERISLPLLLQELREGQTAYWTASVGRGPDKLGIVPDAAVHRVVDEDGVEHLSSEPCALTADPLLDLPTAEQLFRWFLRNCPTF